MDKRTLKGHDINGVNGHHTFGIAESHYAYSKNNTFMVEFETIDDVTMFIMINYDKIIY